MSHHEIIKDTTLTNKQRKILIAIANYNEGWCDENKLEKTLTDIILNKRTKNTKRINEIVS